MQRKNLADIMLLVSFAAFLLTFWAHKQQPHHFSIGLLYMVAEAALVGGVADWFAVTALFRRPLGFPWHTALVPKNRERVVAALAGAVENEFLSIDALKHHLDDVRLTGMLIRWVDTLGGERILAAAVNTVQRALREQELRLWAVWLEDYLRGQVKSRDPLPLLRRGIRLLVASERMAEFVNDLLERARRQVAAPEFRRRLEQKLSAYQQRPDLDWWERTVFWLGKQTNAVNMSDVALVLQNELSGVIGDLQDRNHPLRQWLVEQIVNFSSGERGGSSCQRWRQELAEGLQLSGFAQTVLEGARQAALASLAQREKEAPASPDSMLRIWLVHQLTSFWERFRANLPFQEWVDERLRLVVYHVIETEHHLIGDVVRAALARLDDEALNQFILARAGNDLQWIRINGSLVGGIVGALLYLFLQLVYQPHILPFLYRWR